MNLKAPKELRIVFVPKIKASIAQLDRASVFGTEG